MIKLILILILSLIASPKQTGQADIKYSEKNTTIVNSYLLNEEEINEITKLVIVEREEKGLEVTRTFESYKAEIKVHNILYYFGILPSKTRSADLEENIDKIQEILYMIIGG